MDAPLALLRPDSAVGQYTAQPQDIAALQNILLAYVREELYQKCFVAIFKIEPDPDSGVRIRQSAYVALTWHQIRANIDRQHFYQTVSDAQQQLNIHRARLLLAVAQRVAQHFDYHQPSEEQYQDWSQLHQPHLAPTG